MVSFFLGGENIIKNVLQDVPFLKNDVSKVQRGKRRRCTLTGGLQMFDNYLFRGCSNFSCDFSSYAFDSSPWNNWIGFPTLTNPDSVDEAEVARYYETFRTSARIYSRDFSQQLHVLVDWKSLTFVWATIRNSSLQSCIELHMCDTWPQQHMA